MANRRGARRSRPDEPRVPPRLAPEEPLPSYSYVTRRFPHPTRDPAGHSFGHVPPTPSPLVPAQWRHSRDYLWGCDLFNYGYYWEAHEVWEGLWKACGRTGPTADFLKGLVKLAAAGVKVREGRPEGVRRHAARAAALFARLASGLAVTHYLGFDLRWLGEMSENLRRNPPSRPAAEAPVEIVFDFQLLPREMEQQGH